MSMTNKGKAKLWKSPCNKQFYLLWRLDQIMSIFVCCNKLLLHLLLNNVNTSLLILQNNNWLKIKIIYIDMCKLKYLHRKIPVAAQSTYMSQCIFKILGTKPILNWGAWKRGPRVRVCREVWYLILKQINVILAKKWPGRGGCCYTTVYQAVYTHMCKLKYLHRKNTCWNIYIEKIHVYILNNETSSLWKSGGGD